MSEPTNTTAMASECRRLAAELRTEAQRWRRIGPERFRELCANSLQLAHTANTVMERDELVTASVLVAAGEALIAAMTDRAIVVWNARRG